MTSLVASGIAIPDRLAPTDLRVQPGAMVAIVGPNGGGKTSLLRALAGVEPTAAGQVWVGREPWSEVPPARRPRLLTFLPAARDVPWPIRARDVIALGLPAPDPERVDALLALLELEPLADRPVDHLSTGERARVLLARALAPRPRMLLLDEPASNLDPYWALRILEVLRSEADAGAAVCLSLHDLSLLGRFDRAMLVAGGRVQADMPPERLLTDQRFVAAFRIVPEGTGWRIRPPEGPRSSP